MIINIDADKIPTLLKECFLFYSFKINNYIVSGGRKQYNFNYTENSSLYNFANFIKENKAHYLNINWLFDYFNYQFSYWNFIKEQNEKQTGELYLIQLHWVLGKKALKRFDAKTQKDSYFYHSVFFPKFQIKKDDLIEILVNRKCIEVKDDVEEEDKVKLINTLNKKEEQIKAKKLNTLDGFFLCTNFTTLFRFDSEICLKCNYKNKCKKCLKQNYPKIYQKRIAQKFIRDRINKEKHE